MTRRPSPDPGAPVAADKKSARALARAVPPRLKGSPVTFVLVDGTCDHLDLVWSSGFSAELAAAWVRVPMAAQLPIADVVRYGRPVRIDSISERLVRYPAMAQTPGPVAAAMLLVPVWSRIDGEPAVIGAVGFGFPSAVPPDATQDAHVFAAACARLAARSGLVHGAVRPLETRVVPHHVVDPAARAGDAALARSNTAQGVDADLLRAVLQHVPIGVAVLDADLRFILVNARAAEMNGLEPAQHIGRLLSEVLPGLPEGFAPTLRGVMETGIPVINLDVSGSTLAGPEAHHWRGSYYPVYGSRGDVEGVAALFEEVDVAPGGMRLEQLTAERAANLAVVDAFFRHAPLGIAVLDTDLRYQSVNETLARRNGRTVVEHLGRRLEEIGSDLAQDIAPALSEVLANGTPARDVEVAVGDQTWLTSAFPVPGPRGNIAGVAISVSEITELRRSEREAAAARAAAEEQTRRTLLLQRLTAALAGAVDSREVANVVIAMATSTVGADAAVISHIDRSGMPQVLAARGLPDQVLAAWRSAPVHDNPVVAEAVRSRKPVVYGSTAERNRLFPAISQPPSPHQAWVIVPLLVNGEPTGVAAFGWVGNREFPADTVDLLISVADHTSTAIERARLYDAEHRARARLALLVEASARFTTAATESDRLTSLADVLVGGFADWCGILLPDEDGRLRRVVTRAAAGSLRLLAEEMTGVVIRLTGDDDPRAIAWRQGRVARADLADARVGFRDMPSDVVEEISGVMGAGTLLAAPLVARGENIGVVTVWRVAHRTAFDADDEQLLADLGRRAGIAVDNLRLLAARTYVASRLQDSLLPQALPTIPGVELAARYLAAESSADVGGDLYDAYPLDGGEDGWALIVGDVAGRGVDAAGLTGMTRATLRALAGQLPVPAALARLNSMLGERTEGNNRFLTLAYVQLTPEPPGAVVRVWLAGHPPPILIHGDGTWTELGVPGSLLGVVDTLECAEATYRIGPDDVILMYTDGLIEAHGAGGLFGETQLPALLADLGGRTATDIVTRIEQAIVDYRDRGADDAVLLVARIIPAAEPRQRILLEKRLPADARVMSRSRHAIREAVAPLAHPDRVHDIVVAVNELLNNALQQLIAQPPRSPRLEPILLRLLYRGDVLRVEVSNPGPQFTLPTPPADPVQSGRGLLLVRALATDLGVTTSSGTTCVWFETTTGVTGSASPAGGG